mmetsp:Transcript_16418/g.35492  ORF Transcript_16418/g.35492 Transcript_16418/m.35492 type:complete len:462 (-) Transcript_16418:75-1460(-)
MATDPSSLFLAAALAAGLVEGSSVIRYHRRALLQQSNVENDDGSGNNANSGGSATITSVSILAAHSIFYGIASLPLGIVGASPGLAFLPKFLPASKCAAAPGDAIVNTVEKKMKIEDVKHHSRLNNLPPTPSDMHIVSDTGRGMGRMLRHENSKKMMEEKSASRNKIKPATAVTRPSVCNSISSRYIATLDGAHLPTPLAEAMRRSRCMFIGAGLVSYAITQYLSDRSHNVGNYQFDANYSPGYDRWMNNKSIAIWIEGIKNGKSVNDVELMRQWQNDIAQQDTKTLDYTLYMKKLEAVFGGIYNATKWINLQLGRDLDEPPFSLIRDWEKSETINTNSLESTEEELRIAENNNLDSQDVDDAAQKTNDANPISSMPESQQSQNSHLWKVAVTSVDVLGTSIRHLSVSTYRLASAVATLGRSGQEVASRESTYPMGKVSNDPANSDINDTGKDNSDDKSYP